MADVAGIGYRNEASIQGWLVHLTTPAPVGVAWLLTVLVLVGTFGVIALLLLTSLISEPVPLLDHTH